MKLNIKYYFNGKETTYQGTVKNYNKNEIEQAVNDFFLECWSFDEYELIPLIKQDEKWPTLSKEERFDNALKGIHDNPQETILYLSYVVKAITKKDELDTETSTTSLSPTPSQESRIDYKNEIDSDSFTRLTHVSSDPGNNLDLQPNSLRRCTSAQPTFFSFSKTSKAEESVSSAEESDEEKILTRAERKLLSRTIIPNDCDFFTDEEQGESSSFNL